MSRARGPIFIAVAAAVMTSGACNPDGSIPSEPMRPLLAVNIASGPVGSGNFTNSIVPTNTGRATGAFWDNNSHDETTTATQCNVGFYSVGTLSAGCSNETAGSTANQGGFAGGQYLGSGSGDRAPSDFMFNTGSYSVRLVGSYAGAGSTVGWFTRNGNGYTFHPVPAWSAKIIGHTEVIDAAVTGNRKWGFYIQNGFVVAAGSCDPANLRSCSDATGGFASVPFNQFALFRNGGGTSYLVGAEDNVLELLPDADSDYNDYIWVVTPSLGGCTYTQGFWKTHGPSAKGKNANQWPVSSLMLGTRTYTAAELQSIFNKSVAGNGLISLAHQLIAAKLNLANGTSAPQAVLDAIAAADARIGALVVPPVGTGYLSPSSTSALVTALNAYNVGDTGPGHCGGEQVDVIFTF